MECTVHRLQRVWRQGICQFLMALEPLDMMVSYLLIFKVQRQDSRPDQENKSNKHRHRTRRSACPHRWCVVRFSIASQFISMHHSLRAIAAAAITAASTLDQSTAGTSRMWSSPSADNPRISLKASMTRSGNYWYLEKNGPVHRHMALLHPGLTQESHDAAGV